MSSPSLVATDPATKTSVRPRFQFGLRSLLLLIVVSALAFSAWQQWQLRGELVAWQAKAHGYEQEIELRRGVADVARKLNLNDPEHRRIYQLVGTMDPRLGDSLIRQPVNCQGARHEVLVFHHDGTQCEGAVESVALLMGARSLVDYVIHNQSDWHQAKLEDGDRDGQLDVVYHCRTGSYGDKRLFTERYTIQADGFQRVE
jgi:hypothetical protein